MEWVKKRLGRAPMLCCAYNAKSLKHQVYPLDKKLGWAGRNSSVSLIIFSVVSLKRQHSKKGNFVSSIAGVSGRDLGYSKH